MHTTTKIRMATTKTKVPNPVRTINMEALAMLVMAPTALLETMGTTRTMRTKTETTVVVVTVAISELPDKLVIVQYIYLRRIQN